MQTCKFTTRVSISIHCKWSVFATMVTATQFYMAQQHAETTDSLRACLFITPLIKYTIFCHAFLLLFYGSLEQQQTWTKCCESQFRYIYIYIYIYMYIWAKCTMPYVVDEVAWWLGFFIVSEEGVPTTHCYVYGLTQQHAFAPNPSRVFVTWASQTCPKSCLVCILKVYIVHKLSQTNSFENGTFACPLFF